MMIRVVRRPVDDTFENSGHPVISVVDRYRPRVDQDKHNELIHGSHDTFHHRLCFSRSDAAVHLYHRFFYTNRTTMGSTQQVANFSTSVFIIVGVPADFSVWQWEVFGLCPCTRSSLMLSIDGWRMVLITCLYLVTSQAAKVSKEKGDDSVKAQETGQHPISYAHSNTPIIVESPILHHGQTLSKHVGTRSFLFGKSGSEGYGEHADHTFGLHGHHKLTSLKDFDAYRLHGALHDEEKFSRDSGYGYEKIFAYDRINNVHDVSAQKKIASVRYQDNDNEVLYLSGEHGKYGHNRQEVYNKHDFFGVNLNSGLFHQGPKENGFKGLAIPVYKEAPVHKPETEDIAVPIQKNGPEIVYHHSNLYKPVDTLQFYSHNVPVYPVEPHVGAPHYEYGYETSIRH